MDRLGTFRRSDEVLQIVHIERQAYSMFFKRLLILFKYIWSFYVLHLKEFLLRLHENKEFESHEKK
jgi:hypothetical protein